MDSTQRVALVRVLTRVVARVVVAIFRTMIHHLLLLVIVNTMMISS